MRAVSKAKDGCVKSQHVFKIVFLFDLINQVVTMLFETALFIKKKYKNFLL